MLLLQHISYQHPNKDVLFHDLDLTVDKQNKIALVGNNGAGKSTLLKIMAGILPPSAGWLKSSSKPYYVPQHFGQFNELTIAQALAIDDKLIALQNILDGNVTDKNLAILNDDWTIEDRCEAAFGYWNLNELDIKQPMKTLSGGQKTKVFLAGISIHQPDIVLMDEPSNHLDFKGREMLYHLIESFNKTLVVVSHDKKLLNLLDVVLEVDKRGITNYGGNYDFYKAQKAIENNALNQDVNSKEKALRKAKEVKRETIERQQKLDARGRKKQEKAGLPTILMNTLRNSAEKSTGRIKDIHAEKVNTIAQELDELRDLLPDIDKMKFGFDNSALHKGKILIEAKDINYCYNNKQLWKTDLYFQINSGERIALKGLNGAGKTTLIKIMLGTITPTTGIIYKAITKAIYIDQDYSLVNNQLNVYQQAQQFNSSALQEHEIKIRLNRFLFTEADWDKPCAALSGGERMRLIICCLTIGNKAPDMIILDEPTNNLDMQNIEILTNAIVDYAGTLIVVSHDQHFLEQVNIGRTIELQKLAGLELRQV